MRRFHSVSTHSGAGEEVKRGRGRGRGRAYTEYKEDEGDASDGHVSGLVFTFNWQKWKSRLQRVKLVGLIKFVIS